LKYKKSGHAGVKSGKYKKIKKSGKNFVDIKIISKFAAVSPLKSGFF